MRKSILKVCCCLWKAVPKNKEPGSLDESLSNPEKHHGPEKIEIIDIFDIETEPEAENPETFQADSRTHIIPSTLTLIPANQHLNKEQNMRKAKSQQTSKL
nr:PREDICTED: uncharacterized protein LOC106704847 isoform X2 [Latimeria chalumnae]|eukprot:XP_014348220.1 PREDICTED: uncharacterized protein LOC106704847 isoform X2 [Latimeria chalumnae]